MDFFFALFLPVIRLSPLFVLLCLFSPHFIFFYSKAIYKRHQLIIHNRKTLLEKNTVEEKNFFF